MEREDQAATWPAERAAMARENFILVVGMVVVLVDRCGRGGMLVPTMPREAIQKKHRADFDGKAIPLTSQKIAIHICRSLNIYTYIYIYICIYMHYDRRTDASFWRRGPWRTAPKNYYLSEHLIEGGNKPLRGCLFVSCSS